MHATSMANEPAHLGVQRHRGVDDAVAHLLYPGAEALEVAAQDGAVDALQVAPVVAGGGEARERWMRGGGSCVGTERASSKDVREACVVLAYLLGMVQEKVAKCRCARSHTSNDPACACARKGSV